MASAHLDMRARRPTNGVQVEMRARHRTRTTPRGVRSRCAHQTARRSAPRSARPATLGFKLYRYREQVKIGVAESATAKMKDRVRALTRRVRGKSLACVVEDLRKYLQGWKQYFAVQQRSTYMQDLDKWIRHRLRAFKLKQWRRGTTAFREARKMGASPDVAAQIAGNLRRWWLNARRLAHTIMPNRFFDKMGLPRLAA